MQIRNPKDLVAGLLFAAFGVLAVVVSSSYAMGSASRMGPGYLPRALGVLLIAFGAALALRGLRPGAGARVRWNVVPLLVVLAAVGLFSMAAKWLGVVASTLLLVVVASAVSGEFRWREALISGLVLGAAAVAVFVYALGIPLPVWPAFVGR